MKKEKLNLTIDLKKFTTEKYEKHIVRREPIVGIIEDEQVIFNINSFLIDFENNFVKLEITQ